MFELFDKVIVKRTQQLGVVHGIKVVENGIKYQVKLPTNKKWFKQKRLLRAI